jgi:ABC-type multidrug transport system fused ATPase/permease subunit
MTSVAPTLRNGNEVNAGRPQPNGNAVRSEFRHLFGRYRWRILLTYSLFNAENLLRLAQPLLLGWAINGLLRSSFGGVIMFACGHVAHMMMRTWRQMYDTRTFTRIYAERANQLVTEQRGQGIDASRVTARSSLARQFVDFFESHVPLVIRSTYSIFGAAVMLAWFDGTLVLFCVALIVPACLLNFVYGQRTLSLSVLLHDDLEREVSVVQRADTDEVRDYCRRVSRRHVRLSDCEAITSGAMEVFVLALMVGTLIR